MDKSTMLKGTHACLSKHRNHVKKHQRNLFTKLSLTTIIAVFNITDTHWFHNILYYIISFMCSLMSKCSIWNLPSQDATSVAWVLPVVATAPMPLPPSPGAQGPRLCGATRSPGILEGHVVDVANPTTPTVGSREYNWYITGIYVVYKTEIWMWMGIYWLY